tara:strand:+ start:5894 stop:6163 length:270 start_codon:yes stop_codon:yes gene_type:complete
MIMDKTLIKNQAISLLKDNKLLDAFAEIYAKKLNIDIDDAKKFIEVKTEKRLDNITNLLESRVNQESIKNKSENINLDEYLNNKPVIKG